MLTLKINNINTVIDGNLSTVHFNKLKKLMRYRNPAFMFMPNYRKGGWSGWYELLKKNKKEIYEGDIVKATMLPGRVIDECSKVGVVEWNKSSYVFKQECKDIIKRWNVCDTGIDYEIVGNITENPELLSEIK